MSSADVTHVGKQKFWLVQMTTPESITCLCGPGTGEMGCIYPGGILYFTAIGPAKTEAFVSAVECPRGKFVHPPPAFSPEVPPEGL